MSRTLQNIRNIGIIAHIDAGRECWKGRTVTKRMLFYSNFVHKVGMVDQEVRSPKRNRLEASK